MELDNGILGARNGPARLFYHTEKSLLGWGFQRLQQRSACARVFSKNALAIKLHKSVGLMPVRREPLRLEVRPDGERHYHAAREGAETDVPFDLVALETTREAFLKLHTFEYRL